MFTNEGECPICKDSLQDLPNVIYIYIPCGHFVCKDCDVKLVNRNKCVVCRKNIEEKVDYIHEREKSAAIKIDINEIQRIVTYLDYLWLSVPNKYFFDVLEKITNMLIKTIVPYKKKNDVTLYLMYIYMVMCDRL